MRLLPKRIIPTNIVSWATRGILAIADQGLFAGSNLVVNVFLARWLSAASYGVFALAYSVFVLFSSLQSATFIEPMLVFGPGKYRDNLDQYLGLLIRGHFLVMLPASFVMAVAVVLLGHWLSSAVIYAFLALSCTIPVILLSWMLRRAFYIELQPLWAMYGGLVYLIVLLALLFGVQAVHKLSTVTALLVMGLASVIVNVFLMLRLRPDWKSDASGISLADVASLHWRYGRWSVAAAAAGWIPLNIYYVLLPAWFGFEQSALLRALMNLINPIIHVLVALTPILLPTLVRNRRHGLKAINRTINVSLTLLLSLSGMFSGVIWFFRKEVFQLLYGGKYQEFSSGPLVFLFLSLLATCFIAVLAAGQMALEYPEGNFWAYVVSSVVTITVGLPLTAWRGVEGAAEGLLLSSSVAAACMYYFFRKAMAGQAKFDASNPTAHLAGEDGDATLGIGRRNPATE